MQAVLMPHLKKGAKLNLPLPWENEVKETIKTPEQIAKEKAFWEKVDKM